ncbi:MAG TPA: heparinase II/III family protein, partial [Pyrinomonadaceae bacterium]
TAHHNSVLVDGRGQAKEGEGHDAFEGVPYEQLNRIRVVEARLSAGSAVVVGDAAAAYDSTLGLTRFERRFEFDGRGFNVTDELESTTPRTFTALVHADDALKQEGAGRFSIGGAGARLDILVEAPRDARAVVEENVLTAPGPPGSVDKGERQVRGRRLAVSTPAPQTRTRFRLRLSVTGN